MDPLLIFTQLTLGALGILGVATSAPELWPAHLARVLAGLALTFLVSRISPQRVVRLSPYAYIGTLILLRRRLDYRHLARWQRRQTLARFGLFHPATL